MVRRFLGAASAVAVFFLGSMAFVYLLTSGPSEAPPEAAGPPRGEPSPEPLPADPRPSQAAPSLEPDQPQPPPPAAPAWSTAPRAAGEPRFREGMPAGRRAALSSFRRELIAGVRSLREHVAECVRGPRQPAAAAPQLDLVGARFTLVLETTEGGIRVVDARVESRGAASDEQLACARLALTGQVIPAAGAEPGRQWELSI